MHEATRFAAICDLWEFALAQMEMNLRRRFPDADEAEIAHRLARWSAKEDVPMFLPKGLSLRALR